MSLEKLKFETQVLRSLGLVVSPSLVTEIMEKAGSVHVRRVRQHAVAAVSGCDKVDYDGSGELSFDEFESYL